MKLNRKLNHERGKLLKVTLHKNPKKPKNKKVCKNEKLSNVKLKTSARETEEKVDPPRTAGPGPAEPVGPLVRSKIVLLKFIN